ncbi:MAG TPA: alpha/beta fold hydrolase [Candidatus Acidoferrales bacterium]|nr:alpha/beta fold hydrolase [Candidatus Acidoferrales bacterium]
MKTFASFDGASIAFHDEGEGFPVILLHGYGVDALGQFGSFDRILPILKERQELFIQTFGGAPPLPDPPVEGRPGIIPALRAARARVILPDLRGFGASAKSREPGFYADWAMARDVIALVEHLRFEAVDIVGFSMGAGAAARVAILGPPQLKSAILAGIGDYAVDGTPLEFPKNWPVPEHLPKPLTHKIWAEEGARVLEKNELVPGNLGSAHVIAARVTGADPRVLAAVIRGAVADQMTPKQLNRIRVPILVLNGTSDVANQKTSCLLKEISTASLGVCDGDHSSTTYQPSFHQAVIGFLERQWRERSAA